MPKLSIKTKLFLSIAGYLLGLILWCFLRGPFLPFLWVHLIIIPILMGMAIEASEGES